MVFGGEVDPSNKGHEGAGGFSNDLILIDEDLMDITVVNQSGCNNTEMPLERGWSAGDTFYDSGKHRFVIFGGLSGDDNDPLRLNDLWICTMSEI